MKISRAALAVAAVLSFAAVSAPASASIVTYDWTLTDAPGVTSGGLVTGSGTLTVDTSQTQVKGFSPNFFTGDLVTSLTGTLTGGATVSLLAPGTFFGSSPSFGETNSNFLFPTANSLVDAPFNANSFNAGIGFASSSGNFLLFGSNAVGGEPAGNNGYSEVGLNGAAIGQGGFSVTLAPVPLPASAWMLLLGLAGLGFVAVRQSKQQAGTGFAAI